MDEQQESIRRIRRGCIGGAAILLSMAVLLVTSTGNLFWSLFALAALILLLLSRIIK